MSNARILMWELEYSLHTNTQNNSMLTYYVNFCEEMYKIHVVNAGK